MSPARAEFSTTSWTSVSMRARAVVAEQRDRLGRQVGRIEVACARGVVDVVVDIGDAVGDAHDAALEGLRHLRPGVVEDAVAHLPRQVEAAAVVLQHVDDAQALLVVVESAGRGSRSSSALFAGVTERRVAEVVPERDRLGELLVEPQHLGDRPRDLRHLERVREPRAVVVAVRREEHLRLVLQPAERLAVDDAVAVALERRPQSASSSGTSRPRVSYERTASGESHCSSCSRTASAKPSATCPAISGILRPA